MCTNVNFHVRPDSVHFVFLWSSSSLLKTSCEQSDENEWNVDNKRF